MADLVVELREWLREEIETAQRARHKLRAYAPASAAELAESERRLGFPLPALLRRVYTEVANGWDIPGCNLLGLVNGARDDLDQTLVDYVEAMRQPDPDEPQRHWPPQMLALAHLGCAMYACARCDADGVSMYLFDPAGHSHGQTWDAHFATLGATLEEWLVAYINGEPWTRQGGGRDA